MHALKLAISEIGGNNLILMGSFLVTTIHIGASI